MKTKLGGSMAKKDKRIGYTEIITPRDWYVKSQNKAFERWFNMVIDNMKLIMRMRPFYIWNPEKKTNNMKKPFIVNTKNILKVLKEMKRELKKPSISKGTWFMISSPYGETGMRNGKYFGNKRAIKWLANLTK